jgi:hypothetical protein
VYLKNKKTKLSQIILIITNDPYGKDHIIFNRKFIDFFLEEKNDNYTIVMNNNLYLFYCDE